MKREKRVVGGKEGLEGEDFPGKFRETPRPPDPTRTSFAQNQRPPPIRGRSPTPSLPLAYAHMCGNLDFFALTINLMYKTSKIKSHVNVKFFNVCNRGIESVKTSPLNTTAFYYFIINHK